MEYISSILWFLSWPLLIIISYQLIKYFVKRTAIDKEKN
jgi:hypothetical protein